MQNMPTATLATRVSARGAKPIFIAPSDMRYNLAPGHVAPKLIPKMRTDTKYTVRARELAQITGADGNKLQRARKF